VKQTWQYQVWQTASGLATASGATTRQADRHPYPHTANNFVSRELIKAMPDYAE